MATKRARTMSSAPAMRAAYLSASSGLEFERKRQKTTVAESSSIALSPPNPRRAGLLALHAARSETAASTTIQAIVNLWSWRMRRLKEGVGTGSVKLITFRSNVPRKTAFGPHAVRAKNVSPDQRPSKEADFLETKDRL